MYIRLDLLGCWIMLHNMHPLLKLVVDTIPYPLVNTKVLG